MKINKGIPLIGVREDRCAVYFDNKHIKLNACARDALNDPDLVEVKFDKEMWGRFTLHTHDKISIGLLYRMG